MKKVLILLLISFFVFGCISQSAEVKEQPEISEEEAAKIEVVSTSDVISTCNSLCNNDKEAYCLTQRKIEVNGEEKIGTCRSFAKKGNVDGFSRCQGFCNEYGHIN